MCTNITTNILAIALAWNHADTPLKIACLISGLMGFNLANKILFQKILHAQELEADKNAVCFTGNKDGAITFLNRMAKYHPNSLNNFSHSHPSINNRIEPINNNFNK